MMEKDEASKWAAIGARHLFEQLSKNLPGSTKPSSQSVVVFIAGDYLHPLQGRTRLDADEIKVEKKGSRLRSSRDRWIQSKLIEIRSSFQQGMDAAALAKLYEQSSPYQVFWFIALDESAINTVLLELLSAAGPNDYTEHELTLRHPNDWLFEVGADYSHHWRSS